MHAGATRVVLALTSMVLLLGCDQGLGGGVTVINESPDAVTIYGQRIGPDGGRWRYEGSGCGKAPLVFLDTAGTEYARIDAGWCAGETWVITAEGEVSTSEDG